MKRNIACLLLAALSIIILPLLFAQQDQNSQGPDPEIAALKKRISELENKLQTVENVEKMELAAKLADAQAKLLNAETDKYKRELKDANDEWLRIWSLWFAGIIGFLVLIIGGAFWFWLRSRADQLIADSVEKSLNDFKEAVAQVDILKNELIEAVGQVNILQDQVRILEKEHAASVLENFINSYIGDVDSHPEQIRTLHEEVLLQLFNDETRWVVIRDKAAEVLAARKSAKLVSPALKQLNSVVNSNLDWESGWETTISTRDYFIRLVNFVGRTHTDEAYQGLTKFLNRLLTEDPKHKDLFLIDTILSLARISVQLNMRDSVTILKSAMSHFEHPAADDLRTLAVCFDRLDDPTGIKDILTEHLTNGMSDAEDTCLELLQKHDPEFVEQWKAQKETANTQTEASE